MSSKVFDKKQLAKDILETIAHYTDGKQFLGHDGRKYRLVYSDRKPASGGFFDVIVKRDDVTISVASYAVVLIGVSPH